MFRDYVKIVCFIICLIAGNQVYSQDDNVYGDMSLEEILDVNIVVSASKETEDLFETPLSVTLIKKDEIQEAGCRSIVEALKLSSGLIVRETTPGNYDIHIRGFDDANKNYYVPIPFNSTILVMIDNRVVFSYFSGGTFWENLPVGIQDIERIEIVRGPASALYGPNAVNGVINFITSHANEQKLNTFASATYGTRNEKTLNTSVGYNFNDKTKVTVSANTSARTRFDDKYYSWAKREYVKQDDLEMLFPILRDTVNRILWTGKEFMDSLNSYADEDISMHAVSANVFLNHNFSLRSKIDISTGFSESKGQKPGNMNFLTPMSESHSKSQYFDARLKLNQLYIQANVVEGEDLNNFMFNSYKYNVTNFILEYNWQITKSFRFRPGFDVREFTYESPLINSTPFNFANANKDFKNLGKKFVSNEAFFFLSEWQPNKKIRFIGGIRIDTFNLSKVASINYQFATTYRINKNNLVRFVTAKASRSPFIFDTYLNAKSNYDMQVDNKGTTMDVTENYKPLGMLKYPTNYNLEAGWRCKPEVAFEFDFEVFASRLTNILSSISNTNIIGEVNFKENTSKQNVNFVLGPSNNGVNALQYGLSLSTLFHISQKINLTINGTLQTTSLHGFNKYHDVLIDSVVTTDTLNETIHYNISRATNAINFNTKSTPNLYGSVIFNYKPTDKWNINFNAYFYSRQEFANVFAEDADAIISINPWANLNLKVAYYPVQKLSVFASCYNLLGMHRELFGSDKIGTSVWLGLQWGF